MKLEPNMYVRTKHNGIGKIVEYINDPTHYFFKCYKLDINCINCEEYITEADVIKEPSYSIIDLIEVGDYVNELPVEGYYTRYDEEKDDYIKIGIITLEDYWKGTFTSIEDIKSIVTKEQFSSIEYRLGDDK